MDSRIVSVLVTCGLTIMLASPNMLTMVGGPHVLSTVSVVRTVSVPVVLLARGERRVDRGHCVAIVRGTRDV